MIASSEKTHILQSLQILPYGDNYLQVIFFCGFGILCILLVLNFMQASQLIIFMMVNIQFIPLGVLHVRGTRNFWDELSLRLKWATCSARSRTVASCKYGVP